MIYHLSWYSTLQKPSESAMYYEFEACSLDVALSLALKWWRNQVLDFCGFSVVPYTIDELISHQFGVYAYLSDDCGIIVADLRSLTPGNSSANDFVFEVRKGVI